MARAIDLTKLRQGITKNIKGISAGFHDPIDWISTGSYLLNYRISGDFMKGVPYGKVSIFAGESGSGKSFICSGNLVRNAQEDGAYVILMDSENALDEKWLQALDVDTSEEKLLKLGVSQIDDVGKTLSDFIDGYNKDYDGLEYKEKPKVLVVVDSLGMLLTPTDTDQFNKGDMKGDFGRKAKMLTALVRNLVNRIAQHPIAIVCTNHTYSSQDMFDPDDKISGGSGFIYASSIVIAMKKKKLRDKELAGGSTSQIMGIKAACKVMKSRYAKPFEAVDVFIPYDSGMDACSGLLEMFEAEGVIKRVGNRYSYTTRDGEELIDFKKNWTNEMLTVVMQEFSAAEQHSELNQETPELLEAEEEI